MEDESHLAGRELVRRVGEQNTIGMSYAPDGSRKVGFDITFSDDVHPGDISLGIGPEAQCARFNGGDGIRGHRSGDPPASQALRIHRCVRFRRQNTRLR